MRDGGRRGSTSSVPRRSDDGTGRAQKPHLGEHGSVFCTDVDEPWYGDCCQMMSTCYHVCNFDKPICDNVFEKCARGFCDALDAPDKCNAHLHDLLGLVRGHEGCRVFLNAQHEACACMHNEL